MQTAQTFALDDADRAAAYDELQVPTLFRPWAVLLARSFDDWRGRTVLDLATGTGIVAEVLAAEVGPEGRVIGVDPSEAMLERARRRGSGLETPVTFVQSSAHPLDLPNGSVDVVVCQQGFQFFPDRAAAAAEIHRVLRPGGRVLVSAWSSLADCEYFRALHDVLAAMGEPGLAAKLEGPFDRLSAEELGGHFAGAGFVDVQVGRRQRVYTFPGGVAEAVATAHSTVVGAALAQLPAERRADFGAQLAARLRTLTCDGTAMGLMVANLLTATRA